MNSQAYRDVQAKVKKLKTEGKIAPDFEVRQSFEVLTKELSKFVDDYLYGREKADKKYEQSEKRKARKMAWEKIKTYYKTGTCITCGQEKRIVSKGRCDSCRRKK
jgi:transcription elongation factor Elf1